VSVRPIPGTASVLVAPSRWQRITTAYRELLSARELIFNLVRRDLKVRHRYTFLGMLWSLATPLMLVGLYYFIFKFIMRASPAPDAKSVPFALYFFCGLTLWNFFNNSVGAATGSVTGSGYLLRKVYFPREILPLTSVLSSLVTFGFEAVILLLAVFAFVGLPGINVLWVPVIILIVGVLAYGIALFLSAATVFFRDIAHFIGILMQLWFWGTPIIYSISFVEDRPNFARILKLNPMTGPIVGFRNALLLDRPVDVKLIGYSAAVAVVALLVGLLVFHRKQRLFSEMV
jgi:ABC-2 type transport system permease protein